MAKKVKVLYIVGTGHSGSTLLNLLLGTAKNAFCLSELSRIQEGHDFTCDCGKKLNECPFWSKIISKYPSKSVFKIFSSLKEYFQISLHSFFPNKFENPYKKIVGNYCDEDMYHSLLEMAKKVKGDEVEFLIDSSKGLNRLVLLSNMTSIDLNVVHLVRDGRAVLNSYRKLSYSMVTRFFKWTLLNFVTRKYLKTFFDRNDYYFLSYDLFAKNPDYYMGELSNKFGFKLKEGDLVKALASEDYHNFSGNKKTIRFKGIKEIRYDESWKKQLPLFTKVVINILTYFQNKAWVYSKKRLN